MATRTRQEYLKDLANNYSSTTMVDTGQKFCKLFSNRDLNLNFDFSLDPQPQSFQTLFLSSRTSNPQLVFSYSYAVVQQ